jgi:anti-anti-sigma regulatory factor
MAQIDSTGAEMLLEAHRTLDRRGVRLALSGLHTEVRQLLERAGLIATIGPDMVFDNLEDALDAFATRGGAAAAETGGGAGAAAP